MDFKQRYIKFNCCYQQEIVNIIFYYSVLVAEYYILLFLFRIILFELFLEAIEHDVGKLSYVNDFTIFFWPQKSTKSIKSNRHEADKLKTQMKQVFGFQNLNENVSIFIVKGHHIMS